MPAQTAEEKARDLHNRAARCYDEGNPAEALRILEPMLEKDSPLPHTQALASLCCAALGRPIDARRHLKRAIRDWDATASAGDAHLRIDCALTILLAAGEVGDHRLLLELHRRLPGQDEPEAAFYAGVAAFNLRRFGQAIRLWEPVREGMMAQALKPYIRTARLVEQGLVPPFSLDYRLALPDLLLTMLEDPEKVMAERLAVRALLLHYAFEDIESGRDSGWSGFLFRFGGDWGIELGRRFLTESTLPMELKVEAAHALTELGHFKQGEPIPIIHNGRETELRLEDTVEPPGERSEVERIIEQSEAAFRSGRAREAIAPLIALRRRGVKDPNAMLLEARCLWDLGREEPALALVRMVDRKAHGDPFILFRIAVFYYGIGWSDKALEYLDRINPLAVTPRFVQVLLDFKKRVTEDIARWRARWGPKPPTYDYLRKRAEQQPISLEVTVAEALRRIPVQWLYATAKHYRVSLLEQEREQIERSLEAVLLDPDRVAGALAAEDERVRQALEYLLKKGGWSRLQPVTNSFGVMEGDGFYWDQHPPKSFLGRLRLLGLVFVGTVPMNGKNFRVAVVPADQRPFLSALLGLNEAPVRTPPPGLHTL